MDEVGHSALLKYVVADSKIKIMSQPNFNERAPFDNTNVMSWVPGEQKLRDGSAEEVPGKQKMEDAINVEDDAGKTDAEERFNANTQEDVVFTPVLTVTKEEAVFTKGDLKMQKVTVTEDMSVRFQHLIKKRTAPGKTVVTQDSSSIRTVGHERISIINNADGDEVFMTKSFKKERQIEDQDLPDSKRPKTRIPTLRFREAVDKLKQNRTSFEDKKDPENLQPTPRRSSIPRLKDSKMPPLKTSTLPKEEKTEAVPRLSDEFDKLYDEIADDQDSLDNLSITSRIEDPAKLDNTFEEIIHAYEENNVQPIHVEKVKQSKIPLLKRKSENEIDVPKTIGSVLKQSVSVDISKTKTSEVFSEDNSKIYSITLNKSPIRTSLVSKRVSETNSVRESASESFESNTTVNIDKVQESNSNTIQRTSEKKITKEVFNKTLITSKYEENVNKTEKIETVKVATPTIENVVITDDSYKTKIKKNDQKTSTSEFQSVDEIKEQSIHTRQEETQINSQTKVRTKEIQRETSRSVNEMENIEKTNHKDVNVEAEVLENKNEEDILILRGKVNRIIKRMDSKETEMMQNKQDFANEIPKSHSVLSKIAIFENSEPDDVTSKPKLNSTAEISEIKPNEPTEIQNDLSDDAPKIVKEVLKTLPPLTVEQHDVKDSDRYLNKLNITDNNTDVAVTNFDPNNNEQIEKVNIQPQQTIQSKEPVQILENNREANVIHKLITNQHPPSKPEDNKPTYDHLIVNIQPKSLVSKRIETEINTIEQNDITPENTNQINAFRAAVNEYQNSTSSHQINFSPTLVETKVLASSVIQNKSEYFNNNQDTNSFKKHVAQEKELTETYNKREDSSKIMTNNITYFDDSEKNKPTSINNRVEIISDVVKQEVKYERRYLDEKIKTEKITENEVFYRKARKDEGPLRIHAYRNNELDKNKIKSKSLAELDLGEAVKGKVKNIIVRMNSTDWLEGGKKEIIDFKEKPRKRSVSEKIALFERKLTPIQLQKHNPLKLEAKEAPANSALSEEEYARIIEELALAKTKYGAMESGKMKYLELKDGGRMPAIGLGTALLDPKLTRHIVHAAIDLGYRTIDTAYIYGNEKEVGAAINEKIKDGTVTRAELFVVSKLWSTFHRQDLVARACQASLDAMGLEYFDLYLIHNPMSFKEGGVPIPKIANVLQYSEHDYLDAWFGVEAVVAAGLARRGGVSNFNSVQVDRLVEKGKIKPVVNQVECHPYLSQHRLQEFCQARNVQLSCFGVLGSKGTPQEHKSALPPAVDDPLVRVMAAGLAVTPAVLLISYQLTLGRGVVVKASTAAHLWDNLQSLTYTPNASDVSALHALNRNKRTFTFKGMGDTHRNYPFNTPF